jgi:hypothetical protein
MNAASDVGILRNHVSIRKIGNFFKLTAIIVANELVRPIAAVIIAITHPVLYNTASIFAAQLIRVAI